MTSEKNKIFVNIINYNNQQLNINVTFYTKKQIIKFISFINESLSNKLEYSEVKSNKVQLYYFGVKSAIKIVLASLLFISYVSDYITMPYKLIDNTSYLDGSYKYSKYYRDTGIIPQPNEINNYSDLSFYECIYGNSYLRYLLNPYSMTNNFCLEVKYQKEYYEENKYYVLNKFNYLDEPIKDLSSEKKWKMPNNEFVLDNYLIKIVFFKTYENEIYNPSIVSFVAFNDNSYIIRFCLQDTMGRDYYDDTNELLCELKNGFLLPWH